MASGRFVHELLSRTAPAGRDGAPGASKTIPPTSTSATIPVPSVLPATAGSLFRR
jgi:hypothetical protein